MNFPNQGKRNREKIREIIKKIKISLGFIGFSESSQYQRLEEGRKKILKSLDKVLNFSYDPNPKK